LQKQQSCAGSLFMSTTDVSTDIGAPGTADLPWSELGFEFRPTKSHLRMIYKDGKWGEAELVEVSFSFVNAALHVSIVEVESGCVGGRVLRLSQRSNLEKSIYLGLVCMHTTTHFLLPPNF
jgi:hypothetical protein